LSTAGKFSRGKLPPVLLAGDPGCFCWSLWLARAAFEIAVHWTLDRGVCLAMSFFTVVLQKCFFLLF
jgi:hypothetical protein